MNNEWAFGDIVRVAFPFADSEGHKERPAVIVSSAMYHLHRPDVMVVALSGRLTPLEPLGEYLLADWQSAGLQKPSRIKAVIATVKSDRIIGKIGHLSTRDETRMVILLTSIFGHAAA